MSSDGIVGRMSQDPSRKDTDGVAAWQQHMKSEQAIQRAIDRNKQHAPHPTQANRSGLSRVDSNRSTTSIVSMSSITDDSVSIYEDMRVPPESERIREEVLQRLNLAREWQERRLVLSKTDLFVTLIGHDVAVERIPLHQVTRVSRMEEAGSFKASNNVANVIAFNIQTLPDGYNCGRTYTFKVTSEGKFQAWVQELEKAVAAATYADLRKSPIRLWQTRVRRVMVMQGFPESVALLIGANFLINVVQTQIDPGQELPVFNTLDLAFSIVFTVELAMNLFCHWWRPFWSDPWLVFDFCVVVVSDVAIGKA